MKKVVLGICTVIFVVLCFVFNIFDLDISIALTKLDNGFYEFFDDYGELPIYFGPILFGIVYFFLSKKVIYKIASLGICAGGYLIAVYKVFHNKDIKLNIGIIAVIVAITLVLFLITLFIFYKMKKETIESIKDLALVGLIASVISVLAVEALKLTWGRVRFRDLTEGYKEFTNLFTINGYTGNKSFPSGHTNAATSSLLISLIVPRFTNKKWLKYLVIGFCFGYIALVAFSRIVVSAHYASDVMVGFVVGLLSISITYYVLKRKGVINVASNKC